MTKSCIFACLSIIYLLRGIKLKNKKIVLKPLFHKKVDPLTKLLQEIFAENRFAMSYLGALAIGLGFSQPTKLIAQEDEGVEEVVVTATKRESNAQDLPLSVQAITSEQLEAKNVKDFRDIANLSPSLIVDDSGSGNSYFYARGVSDGGFGNRAGAQASTALYIDDQPLSTIGGNPDLHIYDIERVEILTGPQGTLYGSSSQAGTVKIITKKPSVDGTEFGVDVEYGDIHDGDSDRSFESFVNLPLGDRSAVRISAYDLHTGGWLDNVATTQNFTYLGTHSNADYIDLREDYNSSDKSGYRVRFATETENGITFDLSFLEQDYHSDGSWEADINEGARKVSRYTPETFDDEFSQASLTMSGSLNESIDFTFTSSMFDRDIAYTYDYTQYVYYFGYDYYAAYYYDYDYYASTDPRVFYTQFDDFKRNSNEFRIQSTTDSGYQWILGAFFETNDHEYQTFYDFLGQLSPSLTVVDNRWWGQDNVREDEQKAIFGEVTIPASDKTDLTVGFRKYDTELVPDTYTSDLLKNMEVGFKSTLADGDVVLNGLFYSMNWEDYQATRYVYDYLTVAYVDNVGEATIQGAEIESYFNLSDSMSMSILANFNDPTVDNDTFDIGGDLVASKGNRLAYVPEKRLVITLDKDFVIAGLPAYFGLDYNYTGDRWADDGNSLSMPSYSLMNTRLGVDFQSGTTAELFIRNVNDTDPVLGLYDDFSEYRKTSGQPRVIGVRVRYKF